MAKEDPLRLGKAVKERREEMGWSRHIMAERSRRIDVQHYGGAEASKPGISDQTIQILENTGKYRPTAHTLMLLDATLKWPQGTALAILRGTRRPDGEPLDLPLTPDLNGQTVPAAESDARLRREVVGLRAEVADLAVQLEDMQKLIQSALKGTGR